ncbi:cytochrome P450 [Marasmius fiardii PR-910]|nr:cytochrome P450 [Marasmius fiardii PR-910]
MEGPILIAALTLIAIAVHYLTRKPAFPLPPCPPQTFIGGHYSILPKQQAFLTYTKWAETYGPVFHLRLFNKYTIVLNSAQAALDLLESRSNIYSDRPYSVFLHKVQNRSFSVFQMSLHHPRFRIYRKLMHSGLGPRAVHSYRPLQVQEANILLRALAETPKEFVAHLRRNAGALILKVTYGYEVSGDYDAFIQLVERAFKIQANTVARPFPVEFFPLLRFFPSWFPFTEFKRVAKMLRELRPEERPFLWSKRLIDSGEYVDSFVSRFLRPEDGAIPGEEDIDILKWCAAALYVGGADTTVSAMTSFVYLMVTNPEVQARAQADIDHVTNGDRLPTPDDEVSLPYINAIIKEALRWAPVAPLGLRHRVTQEDTYNGFRIPEGATVIGNIWAITHDPELYPDPDKFNPDRHLGENAQMDPFKFVFGFGRRACPGSYLAERSLFLNVANMLAVFSFEKETDSNGRVLEPPKEWYGGVTSHLQQFPCAIKLRAPSLLPT